MSSSDLDPWNDRPPDWERRVHVLALELSQHPKYDLLNDTDVIGCAGRVVKRIDDEVSGRRSFPPEPCEALVRKRLLLCLDDKLRARRDKANAQHPPREDEFIVLPDVSDTLTRCVEKQLNETRDRDPVLWQLALERWLEGKRKPPMTGAERAKLGRLKAQIREVCEHACEKWGSR